MLGLLYVHLYIGIFLEFRRNVIMQFLTLLLNFIYFNRQFLFFGIFHLFTMVFFFMPICQILISELLVTKSTFDFLFFWMQPLDMTFDHNFLN